MLEDPRLPSHVDNLESLSVALGRVSWVAVARGLVGTFTNSKSTLGRLLRSDGSGTNTPRAVLSATGLGAYAVHIWRALRPRTSA